MTREINKKLDVQTSYIDVELEGRFSRIRTQETNLGNLTADIIRSEYKTDFGLMNSGEIRADRIYEKGVINLSLLP